MKLKIENQEVEVKNALIIATDNKDETFVTITPSTNLFESFQLLHTLSLHLLNAYTTAAVEGKMQEKDTKEKDKNAIIASVKKHLYQMYNEAASSILQLYAPEFELRPDITTEAIQKAEEEIINKRFNELNRKDRRSLPKVVKEAKKNIKNDKVS